MTKHAEEKRNGHSRARQIPARQALVGAHSCDDITSDERSKAARRSRAACSYHVAGGTEELWAELVQPGLLPTLPEQHPQQAMPGTAVHLLARQGVAATTVQDMAAGAGVRRGGRTWPVHTNEALLLAAIDDTEHGSTSRLDRPTFVPNVIHVFDRYLKKQQPRLPLEKNASQGQGGPNDVRGPSLEEGEDPSRPLWRRSACTSVRNERCCMQQRVHLPSQPPAVADRVLVRQTLAGDQDAFEILVRQYHTQVFHFIRRYVSDDDQAWDVFQQVLLKLSMSLPTLCTAGEQLGPWLFRVARNCCIDALRRRRIVRFSELGWDAEEDVEERSPLASLVDPGPSPEETVEHHEVQRVLREAIQGLPPRLRPVVRLRYTDHLSFAEIGQRLQMPASTAKSYFYRARPLLRATLTAQGQTDLPAGEHVEGRLLRMTKQT